MKGYLFVKRWLKSLIEPTQPIQELQEIQEIETLKKKLMEQEKGCKKIQINM